MRKKKQLKRSMMAITMCLSLVVTNCGPVNAKEQANTSDTEFPIVEYLPDIVEEKPLSAEDLLKIHETVMERQQKSIDLLSLNLNDSTEDEIDEVIIIEATTEETSDIEEEEKDDIIDTSVKIFESEELSAEKQHEAKRLAEKYDIPLEILISLAFRESTYRSGIISDDGRDYGLCQIRDINHEWINEELGRELNYIDDIDSMEACCFMLSNLYSKYSYEGWHYILMAYNGGEQYAKDHYNSGTYSSEYSRTVLGKARELGWEG